MSENGLIVVSRSDASRMVAAARDDAPRHFPMTTKDPRLRKFVNGGEVAGGDPMAEIGTTGLRQFGGFVLEEWLNGLQGRRAAWAYREMMDNDPVVGAILFAIEMLARGVNWRVQEGDQQRAEFIESCMHDMSHTWLDFISEMLSMLPYGWAYHEIIYKRRLGKVKRQPKSLDETAQLRSIANDTQEDPNWEPASSEFKDGKIGWRKIPGRAQETLLRWHFDGYSGLDAMEQIDWHGGNHIIPIEKALLFRPKTTRKNPEGRSILRNAWTSYYKLTNVQQIEVIGVERDLAGIPVATPPEGLDLASPGNAEIRQIVEEMVQSIRKDEQQGIVMPSSGWQLELITTGGARQIDTDRIIRRYEQRIASSILADFVLLGQDAVGSFAMVDIKSELFGVAIDTILDIACQVMNEHAIPRLLALNGMKTEDPPQITHSSAGRIDLEKIGRFMQSVALAGGPIPWSKELMEELFKEAGLPAVFDGPLATAFNPSGAVQRTNGLEADGKRPEGKQNDARERALPQRKMLSKAEEQQGVMVCLYPDEATAKALKVKGGEKKKDLHLTLSYLGKLGEDFAGTDHGKLHAVVQGFAAACPPLDGEVAGCAYFEEPTDCTVALVDSPHLSKKQNRLASALTNAGLPVSKEHGFTPHVTLAYDKVKPGNLRQPIKFRSVSIVVGGQRTDFPLTGDPTALSKADDSEEGLGTPADRLGERARLLSAHLAQEIEGALRELGEQASTAYLHIAEKAESPGRRALAGTVQKVMSMLDIRLWIEQRLLPILQNAAGRTLADAQRVLRQETGLPLTLPENVLREIVAGAGEHLGIAQLEPQVREAMAEVVHRSLAEGANPIVTARRIRDAVPAGRFTIAGSPYRAQLIARNETANMQREASLGLYESHPDIHSVRLRDGIYGPPRSDEACIARDGQVVPIGEARTVAPYHPLCTLGFDPILG